MGRNKFSKREIEIIGKLLRLKCAGTRFQQKEIRHKLRVNFEFNISDFNVQGKAFGYDELQECVRRGIIQVLDDATIEAMKAKRARDRQRDIDAAAQEATQDSNNETTDWEQALKEWEEWEQSQDSQKQ